MADDPDWLVKRANWKDDEEEQRREPWLLENVDPVIDMRTNVLDRGHRIAKAIFVRGGRWVFLYDDGDKPVGYYKIADNEIPATEPSTHFSMMFFVEDLKKTLGV